MKTFLKFLCLILCAFALKAANTIYTAPNDTGLVGYWKMDEGGLTNVIDYSGNSNNGTNINGATLTNGVVGGALSFNGINQYVDCGNKPIFDITNNITISCWINTVTWKNYGGLISKGYATTGGYSFHLHNGNVVWFELDEANGARHYIQSSSLTTNTWIFVACSYDGTTQRIYLNSALNTSAAATFSIGSVSDDVLLGSLYSGGGFYDSLLDDARIYNRALSATEITNLYNFRQITYLTNGVTGYKL